MKKATFTSLSEAIEHAKYYGGWIFQGENKQEAEWFNAEFYAPTKIIYETSGTGKIGTWSYFTNN